MHADPPNPRARLRSPPRTPPNRQQAEEEGNTETGWLVLGLRPSKELVERWLDSWVRRWSVLVGAPSLLVWIWCAIPFPVSDPYSATPSIPDLPWPWPGGNSSWWGGAPKHRHDNVGEAEDSLIHYIQRSELYHQDQDQQQVVFIDFGLQDSSNINTSASFLVEPNQRVDDDGNDEDLPVDANFYFFLFVYYGLYLAVALIFVTKLFDLYRLNWWPSRLGGKLSFSVYWFTGILVGLLLHQFDVFRIRRRHHKHGSDQTDVDWERKTLWVALTFCVMMGPALTCFAKLRRGRRQNYRHSLTEVQKSFLSLQLTRRIPRSYIRFLWFLFSISLALFSLLAGQGYAAIYLSTLPHSSLDGLVYVWSWVGTVQVLSGISGWVMEEKIRSRALVFVFRYYYFLVYFIFYRNLFARLRSPDQYLSIQLASSAWVIFFYPFSMTSLSYAALKLLVGYEKTLEQHREMMGQVLYLRNLSENVTMFSFLGWLTILHYGPNRQIYPFFAFETEGDPYNYRLTAVASLVIWTIELTSSFIARQLCWWSFKVDVTNLGLNEFREYPELVTSCVWTAVHVLMDMLFFLIKLNFR
ncbi:hypothetical protein BT69DRAFT_1352576 [Atractiella rhizophila]|nr:hypothetical protein BT69DRAFT_1352576 [Atractiella rhizophila]